MEVKRAKDKVEKKYHLICQICGDKSKSYHYDVPTCNGCKTFFRRSVIDKRTYKCCKGGNCVITKESRCICRGCRWRKCIKLGMNPKAVIAACKNGLNHKAYIKQEIFDMDESGQPESFNSNLIVKPSSISLSSMHDEMNKSIENLLYVEVKNEFLRRSDFLPFNETITLYDILAEPSTFKDTSKYKLIEKWPKSIIKETEFSSSELIKLGYKIWFFLDLMLSIDYLKTFKIFRELPEKDQYYLCRDVACTNAYLSRSYYAYNIGAEIVIYPDGTYPFITSSNLSEQEQILRAGKVQDFNHLKSDRIQYCLMKALTSFNSYCASISEKSQNLIAKERIKYAKFLLIYLQEKFGIDEGNRKFVDSLAIINELIKMKKKYTDTYHTIKHYLKIGKPDPLLFFDLLNINDCM